MADSVNGIGKQVGNYRLTRLLGHGGFADVYLGEHVYLNTQAAIKVLHTQLEDEGIEAFRNEALTIAHLVHPHIVRVLDFDVEDFKPFLVMDYAPNGTLRQRHSKGTRLPSASVVSYVKQVAAALQYAHDQKLIHRDVKPENMLLGHNNDVLLSDFGIALVAQSSRNLQTEDVVVGTMSYMAPEQIQGKARPASDQYALGAVVYEWLCGVRPFRGSYMEIVTQHLSAQPPSFQEQGVIVPPAVEQVVRRALAKDYHQRFPRVQDFADALELAYQAPSPVVVTPPSQRQTAAVPPAMQAPPVRVSGSQSIKTPPITTLPPMTQTPPVRTSSRVKSGGIIRRGISVLLSIVLLVGLGLCGLGYAAYHFFTTNNAPVSTTGTPGATAKANDFVNAVASGNYDHAYNDLSTAITNQTSKNAFLQQIRQEDTCYGSVTGDSRIETDTTAQGNNLNYVYQVTRGKLSRPYQLHVTLQQDNSGNWQITDYNSNIESVQPACS